MASVPPDPVPLLVSLKAVDPAEYPYYGKAELEPAMSLQQALDGDSAVVAEEFLIRLNAQVGQTLRLGGRDFRIAAVLKQEPDRISAGAGMGPRVMISQAALGADRAAGAGQPGQPAAADEAAGDVATDWDRSAACASRVEAALPDAQVMDFREGNPALSQGLDNCDRDSEPDLPGGDGAGSDWRGDGHARASGTAHGHAGDFEGRGRGIGRFAADLSAADAGAGAGRRCAGRGCGGGRDGRAAGGLRQAAAGSCDA